MAKRGRKPSFVEKEANTMITVRIDGELFNRLVTISNKEDLSLNLLCIMAIEEYCQKQEERKKE